MREKHGLTLAEVPPVFLAGKLRVGTRIHYMSRPPWSVRAWRWLRRAVFRRPEPPAPPPVRIVDIDYERRIVTYGAVPQADGDDGS